MRLVSFMFKYDTKFTTEEQERLKGIFPAISFGADDTCWTTLTATMDLALSLGYELSEVKPVMIPGMPEHTTTDELVYMLKRALDANFNTKVEVHVPGDALMKINELRLVEDACTDTVQQMLNDGWRILAICPQPQRRPDYILGATSEAQV